MLTFDLYDALTSRLVSVAAVVIDELPGDVFDGAVAVVVLDVAAVVGYVDLRG